MSFSSDTKKELCRIHPKPAEMMKAELYGLLLFCKVFSQKEISFKTESRDTAYRFAQLITERFGAVVEITKSMSARSSNTQLYKIRIPNEEDCKNIFESFGHDENSVTLRINRANMEYDVCAAGFLRGAFLMCGNISSPESGYHLEFNAVYKNLSEDLCTIIREASEFIGGRTIVPKVAARRSSFVVYIKDSEDISDLLTLMGAGNASMNVMQVKILKNSENKKNRQINSQIANTDRIVSAAAKQVQAIKILKDSGEFYKLSDDLQLVANIRMEHPLSSLKELCTFFDTPISRSGVDRRLKKLIELSELK